MKLHDGEIKTKGYGAISKFFHWTMALLFCFQFLKFCDHIADGENVVSAFIKPWHGSIGIVLFVLVILRLIWAIANMHHRAENNISIGAKVGHFVLYLFMFAVPLSAMALLIGKGWGLKLFGHQIVAGGEKSEFLATIGSYHSPLAIAFLVLVLGHIFAAIMHYRYIKMDGKPFKAFKML